MLPVLTVAGATAGGLLASRFRDLGFWWLVVVLLFGVVLGVSVAWGLLTSAPERTAPPPPGPDRPAPPPNPFPLAPAPNHDPSAASSNPDPSAGGRAWWTEDRSARAAPPAPRLTARELERSVVAQCPNCGDFRLDVAREGHEHAFRCRNPRCGHRWSWRADAAWPTTVVRRNLT